MRIRVSRAGRWVALLASALCVMGVARDACAQQAISSATVGGHIEDASGAALSGAPIVITNLERNQKWNAVSDARGRFQFLYLPVGPYRLHAEAAGFSARDVELSLAVGAALEVPIKLDVAGVTAAIDVNSAPPIVETRRTQVAGFVTPAEIAALPLNGRNYLDLALLVPTVSRTTQTNTQRFAETSAVPGTGISIAGQRNLNNGFIVDGLSANDDAADLAGTYFAEDVIREFQVVTSGGIAEFGRASAGIVNIVTQSGGNQARGDFYGYVRNDRFDAKNYFATNKDPLTRSQYGGSYGGAVVPDRTFWFANVEQTRLNQTSFVTIPQASVDAINQALAQFGYGGPALATGAFPTGYDTTNVFGRVDHQLGRAGQLSVRYSFYDVSSENARNVGGLNAASRGTPLDDQDHTIAMNLVTPLGTRTINELRGQFTRSALSAPPNDTVGPAINISGVASFGTATSSPTQRDLDMYQVTDSVTAQTASHFLKTGIDINYQRVDILFPGAPQGVYAFSSIANLQKGTDINFQQAFGDAAQSQRNPNLGLFVQDEWRPRSDLTVNAGVRYDLQWLDRLVNTDTNNIAPRVGVSYAPGDQRTVIRASGGLYYDRLPLRALSNALLRQYGSSYQVALLSFGQTGAPAFPSVLPSFPAGVLTNITTIDPDIPNAVSRQAGVEVERQLGTGIAASIGYTHLTGRDIIMSVNTNVPTLTAAQATALGIPNLGRPDPRFGNNSQYQGVGESQYDGLTMSLRASGKRWGSLRVSYTLSKALDDTGNAFFNQPQNAFDIRDDWGRSDNDQRHHFVVSGATPLGTLARALDGFQIAYVFSYASAPPFNVLTGSDRNNDTNVNDRPVGVGRNTGVGFDAATLDLRLERRFNLPHGHRIEASIEAFNALNRTNFLNPNGTFGSGATPPATFGQPSVANDPRQVQFGLRWTF
jgi:hypothetical protein